MRSAAAWRNMTADEQANAGLAYNLASAQPYRPPKCSQASTIYFYGAATLYHPRLNSLAFGCLWYSPSSHRLCAGSISRHDSAATSTSVVTVDELHRTPANVLTHTLPAPGSMEQVVISKWYKLTPDLELGFDIMTWSSAADLNGGWRWLSHLRGEVSIRTVYCLRF